MDDPRRAKHGDAPRDPISESPARSDPKVKTVIRRPSVRARFVQRRKKSRE